MNYIGGSGGMLPREDFGKMDSKTPYPVFPGSNATNLYMCILLTFSLSLIIHDSRAEVQRFMIPKFLKQRFKILTYFESMIHDS